MSDKFWHCCCSGYQVQGPVVLDGEASRAEALEKLTKHEAGEWDKEILNLNSLNLSYRHTTEGSFLLNVNY